MILATLGRDQRRLMLLLRIRDAVRPRWKGARRGAPKGPSRDRPGQARVESGPADPEALDLFRRAVAARGLEAVNELYAFYCARVLDASSIASAPAARLAGVPPASAAQISAWLEDALARAPSFAEAWLELGYLRKEAGDESGALDAFERCQRATAAFDRGIGRADPRALAAMELALLLARRGEPESALAQLRAVIDPRWLPWTYHLVHAQSLVALGRPQEALTEFERCLEWTSIESRLDVPLPSRIDELEELLACQQQDANPERLRVRSPGGNSRVAANT
jgi:tetratricopeptide (TPR) repeat protein